MISRRGSQSEEETSSLINHSMSEEERLKEFSFTQEDDQSDHGRRSPVLAVGRHPKVHRLTAASFGHFHFKKSLFRTDNWNLLM